MDTIAQRFTVRIWEGFDRDHDGYIETECMVRANDAGRGWLAWDEGEPMWVSVAATRRRAIRGLLAVIATSWEWPTELVEIGGFEYDPDFETRNGDPGGGRALSDGAAPQRFTMKIRIGGDPHGYTQIPCQVRNDEGGGWTAETVEESAWRSLGATRWQAIWGLRALIAEGFYDAVAMPTRLRRPLTVEVGAFEYVDNDLSGSDETWTHRGAQAFARLLQTVGRRLTRARSARRRWGAT